jgi:hypothetical protein
MHSETPVSRESKNHKRDQMNLIQRHSIAHTNFSNDSDGAALGQPIPIPDNNRPKRPLCFDSLTLSATFTKNPPNMVIFEIDKKTAVKTFNDIKSLMRAAKTWKLTARMEITVLDGLVQLVGEGFVLELAALTTGTCKLTVSVMQWYDLITTFPEKSIKVIVSPGEAMLGKTTVKAQTTFFETDQILRSISLPANPLAVDYLKLEYQGYTQDELQFNAVDTKITWAKQQFEESIRLAALALRPFRISKTELRQIILQKMREKEKVGFEM